MKKRSTGVLFIVVIAFVGIGFSLLAIAASTRVTPGGVQFPDTYLQNKAWRSTGNDIFYNGGKVGIGTWSPETQLHVYGGDSASVVTIDKGPQGLVMQAFDGVFSLVGWGLDYDTGRKNYKNLALRANAKPTGVYIETSGNVGINTWAPEATLHVNGNLKVTGSMPFPAPAYNSGWTNVAKGLTTFTHNLGGNPDNYVVVLDFKGSGTSGHHNVGYGGLIDDDGVEQGASWQELDSNSITVFRFWDDTYCPVVRVRIWVYD